MTTRALSTPNSFSNTSSHQMCLNIWNHTRYVLCMFSRSSSMVVWQYTILLLYTRADLICIRFRLNSPRPIWKIGKWLLHIFPYIPPPLMHTEIKKVYIVCFFHIVSKTIKEDSLYLYRFLKMIIINYSRASSFQLKSSDNYF